VQNGNAQAQNGNGLNNNAQNGIYKPPAQRPKLNTNSMALASVQSVISRQTPSPQTGQVQPVPSKPKTCEMATQTLSTGEITMLNVYFDT